MGKSSLSTEHCWVSERSSLCEKLEDGQTKTPIPSTTESSKDAKCPMPPVGKLLGRLSPGGAEQEKSVTNSTDAPAGPFLHPREGGGSQGIQEGPT